MDGGLYLAEIWGVFCKFSGLRGGRDGGHDFYKFGGAFYIFAGHQPNSRDQQLRIAADVAQSGGENCPPIRSFKDEKEGKEEERREKKKKLSPSLIYS